MPFVKRNADGGIIAVYQDKAEEGLQHVHPDDADLEHFIHSNSTAGDRQHEWLESDLALARVLEDLIDLLIEKGTIRFTDFPEAAQKKLLARRGLRKEFAYVESLFSVDDYYDPDSGSDNGLL